MDKPLGRLAPRGFRDKATQTTARYDSTSPKPDLIPAVNVLKKTATLFAPILHAKTPTSPPVVPSAPKPAPKRMGSTPPKVSTPIKVPDKKAVSTPSTIPTPAKRERADSPSLPIMSKLKRAFTLQNLSTPTPDRRIEVTRQHVDGSTSPLMPTKANLGVYGDVRSVNGYRQTPMSNRQMAPQTPNGWIQYAPSTLPSVRFSDL